MHYIKGQQKPQDQTPLAPQPARAQQSPQMGTPIQGNAVMPLPQAPSTASITPAPALPSYGYRPEAVSIHSNAYVSPVDPSIDMAFGEMYRDYVGSQFDWDSCLLEVQAGQQQLREDTPKPELERTVENRPNESDPNSKSSSSCSVPQSNYESLRSSDDAMRFMAYGKADLQLQRKEPPLQDSMQAGQAGQQLGPQSVQNSPQLGQSPSLPVVAPRPQGSQLFGSIFKDSGYNSIRKEGHVNSNEQTLRAQYQVQHEFAAPSSSSSSNALQPPSLRRTRNRSRSSNLVPPLPSRSSTYKKIQGSLVDERKPADNEMIPSALWKKRRISSENDILNASTDTMTSATRCV
ncbi:hypothetical protein MMC14_008714 [Varicellaria rhodocarpa]|nr:hypothetical protein [Varicellaria rhodocarpa]